MEKNGIRALIELADSIEEADKIIEEFSPVNTTKEKLAYLYGMFDVKIVAAHGDQNDVEASYLSVLSTIINKKWR